MSRGDRIVWSEDLRSFTFDDLRFVTVHGGGEHDEWTPGTDCFLFYKTKALVDQYLLFFDRHPGAFDHVIELGLYDGGSIPFWFELLRPRKHVGIDIRPWKESKVFEAYLDARQIRDRIETHWQTSQADREALDEIADSAFGGQPLNLVIDDASHYYEESRASFEILFPRLRPGGLYIIEDWAWFHWRADQAEWSAKRPLTHLVFELIEAAGSSRNELIESLEVRSGFAVIRRGITPESDLRGFSIDDYIYRHPR